jgi:hypothetical protein
MPRSPYSGMSRRDRELDAAAMAQRAAAVGPLLDAAEEERTMFPIRTGLTKADLVFPTNVDGMIPPHREIPEYPRRQHFEDLAQTWFFSGLKNLKSKPRQGVNETQALAHISYVLRSWEPKHEHKIAGVAFLINEWFEEFSGEAAK